VRSLDTREFSRHLWRAILAPLLLLAAHAAIITILFLYLLSAADSSRQSDEVVRLLSEIERLVVNMETGSRGYLLTGDEAFLQPSLRSRPRIQPTIDDLKELLGDRHAPLDVARSLEETLRLWNEVESKMPAGALTSELPLELRTVITTREKLMNDAREKLRALWMQESNIKAQRKDRERRAASAVLLGGAGVTMILAVMLALINRKTIVGLSQSYESAIIEQAAASQQFADLAESIPQLVWITDGDGKNSYFSRTWTEFTGCDQASLMERGWLSSIHPEDLPVASDRWTRSLKSHSPFEAEYLSLIHI
jgi:CHASE3 domain sensor protein